MLFVTLFLNPRFNANLLTVIADRIDKDRWF